MSVRIQVTDSNGKPIVGAKVIVKWQSGVSERNTDNTGTADTDVSCGTAEYIQVNGHKVRRNIWLDNCDLQIQI